MTAPLDHDHVPGFVCRLPRYEAVPHDARAASVVPELHAEEVAPVGEFQIVEQGFLQSIESFFINANHSSYFDLILQSIESIFNKCYIFNDMQWLLHSVFFLLYLPIFRDAFHWRYLINNMSV